MKPGIPWSVKGIEPEVREAAKHAARRSGMTLGEWLNSVILDQADDQAPLAAPQPGPEQKEFSDMTHEEPVRARSETTIRLEEIAQQLSRLARQEQDSATIRPYEAPAARHADREMFNRVLDRVEQNERQAVEAFSAVNERLSALGRQVAAIGQPKSIERPEDVPGYQALEGALRNIVDHIEVSERRTRDGLKTMQDRLGEMAERAVGASSEDVAKSAKALQGLESRLNDLAVRVQRNEQFAEQSLTDVVKRELSQVGSRIDQVQRHAEQLVASAQSSMGQAAQKELRDIESRIHALLRETQSTMTAQGASSGDVQRLRAEIGQLTQRIEDVRSSAATDRDMDAVRVAVEQLSARMAQGADLRPLADMDRRLADLTQRLESDRTTPRHLPQLGELERRIAELDHRLAEAIRLQGEGHSMVALEEQLQDVNSRLASTESQLGHLDTIERAITQLFDGLEQQRSETGKSIEDAALRAAQQAVKSQPPLAAMPEIQALEAGIRAVRESADQSDRRSQETLEAVHETLEQIVTKLAELETSSAGHQLAAAMSQQAAAAPAPQPAPAPEMNWQQPAPAPQPSFGDFGPTDFQPLSAVPEPQFAPEPTFANNPFTATPAPVEPHLNVPPLHQAAEPLPQAMPDFGQASLQDLGGDQFIAAARRAAQAAANRSSVTNPAERPAAKKGANLKFNFSLPFLAGRKKAAPSVVPGAPQPVPILKAPGSNEKRRKLILAGILLLAMASAVTVNMLGFGKRAAPPQPAPAEVTEPAQKAPDQSSQLAVPGKTDEMTAANTGMPAPDGSYDVTGDLSEITGSISAGKTDASLSAIVAEPGSTSTRAEAPPPEVGTAALREAAARGDAKAQFLVASRYLDGDGVEQDVTKAAHWYQLAASQGLPPAQYRVATLFERGKGVNKDVATAAVWYERAAAGGNVKAMHNAAVIAASSELGTPDYDKAFRLFKQAADRGLQDSEFNLAVLYERGLGTEVKLSEALFWYSMAAMNNDADAKKRADSIAAKLKPDEVAEVSARVESWKPAAAGTDANMVTVTDPAWKNDSTSSAAPADAEEGSAADANPVASVQTMLTRLGYNIGTPDGKMGSRTSNAIRLFQLQSGLKVTGEITPDLIKAMTGKLAAGNGA